LNAARVALEIEAAALARTAERLDVNLCRAVEVILDHPGKVVVTGVGKSGQVGQKLAATLCSIGVPAVFLHAADAVHGDVGIFEAGDPCIAISKSGSTPELVRLLPILKQFEVPLISILGNLESELARASDVTLDGSVLSEASADSPVPTASAVVAMALGDALAVALMQARGFTAADFGRNHPGGQLGRSLRMQVRSAMHGLDAIAWVRTDATFKETVIAMTRHPMGAACVLGEDGGLAGLITEGDLRRSLEAHDDIRTLRAREMMTVRPIQVGPDARLHEALALMENRERQLSVLPVVDPATGACLGLLRLHDIYQVKHG
jgi:arabinose-5-phosphate isomerase